MPYTINRPRKNQTIKRVRELRIKIKIEASSFGFLTCCGTDENQSNPKKHKKDFACPKTEPDDAEIFSKLNHKVDLNKLSNTNTG